MKHLITTFKATFKYKWRAIATIISNVFYVIFNLTSLVLFVPFLKVIFPSEKVEIVNKPTLTDTGITDYIDFISDYYNYFMTSMAQEDPKNALFFVCTSVVISFFFKGLFKYLAVYHQSQLRMSVVRDYRDKMFSKSMRLPISFFTEEKKGDLMSRMNGDVNEVEISVVAMLELIFRDPISVFITLSVLIYWSPALTLFSLILLPISAFIISRIGKSLKRTASKGQKQLGVLFSFLDEYLGGIRIVKAFNASEETVKKFAKINLHHQRLFTRAFRKRDLASPLNEFLGAVVLVTIVWYGGTMILSGEGDGLTGEQFIGFIVVFSQLLVPIQNIAKNSANLSKVKASIERIDEILNADEKIEDPLQPKTIKDLEQGITFQNVSFAYQTENVLKNLSFNLSKGKTVALVGESGSGKSTIADLLPRFYDVSAGDILYDGTNIKDFTVRDLRDQIGIVNQESILFNDTVFNNIAFGMDGVTEEEVINAAKIANAHDFISSMKEGYHTNIGERGNKLSGGQKQRVSIARAVLKNPPIMILDEATSALDTESEKLVQDALDNLMKNRTSLVIAHRLSTIKNADQILVLRKGEIVESGTHDELFARKGLYHKLSTMQGL
ncbi:ABC transporter ATP-binding protein [Brumimicrobium aurantiacum]|uniref:ABC transporter ATP-binding protein n=1 Tax=Brumimicrobium aurantiacum TaxID=1737063 RepID=A0A3E1F2B3_9FLAO|nr:ABC transporter ATP-binding protein [Brumimicrobium aurantiacum]RFC55913.1 ABC transporter ATP-binding protein [Brumimicrobium aurantiacum]